MNTSNAASTPQGRSSLVIVPLSPRFSVCKVADYAAVNLAEPFCFTGCTDEEKSLVCPTPLAPPNALAREDGWRAFRVQGTLNFGLTGILAGIATVLAQSGIAIFAISTFNTDYVLTKEQHFSQALAALKHAGYSVLYSENTATSPN